MAALLEKEFEDLAAFKTAEMPPLGMKRNEKWRETTKRKIRRDLTFFFGAVSLPADAENKKMRGLGVPVEDLSLALVACPLVLDWYMRFKASRTQYTSYMISQLEVFRALLRPGTGWIRQRSDLADKLRPISIGGTEIVTEGLIARARADWGVTCDQAREHYKDLIKELMPSVEVARRPFYRIEGILKMKEPLAVFKLLSDGMKKEIPSPTTQPRHYHSAVRDRVLVLLFAATGLRLRTMSLLNYGRDSDGHLVKHKHGYKLQVPRVLFKEEDSPFFGEKDSRTDYVMDLPDAFGLYEALDEYLNVSRPWLLSHSRQGSNEQPLFVISAGCKSVRAGEAVIYQTYKRAFGKYLAGNKWRGTGLNGVRATGPHSVRHIRATTVVKKTGSFQLAADSIHNSEEMARRHYAMFTTVDRNTKASEILFGGEKNEKEQQSEKKTEENEDEDRE